MSLASSVRFGARSQWHWAAEIGAKQTLRYHSSVFWTEFAEFSRTGAGSARALGAYQIPILAARTVPLP